MFSFIVNNLKVSIKSPRNLRSSSLWCISCVNLSSHVNSFNQPLDNDSVNIKNNGIAKFSAQFWNGKSC